MLQINQDYLTHDTFTDIITFDNSEAPELIETDIFISVERIKENATQLAIPFEKELHRVIIHGILHLLGFNDKSDEEKKAMREEEDYFLNLLNADQ